MKLKAILSLLLPVMMFFQEQNSVGQEIQRDTSSIKQPVKLLFTSNDIIEITLTVSDMKEFLRDVGENPGWHKGLVSYYNNEDSLVNLDVKLQARGHYRKDPANCNFPPIRLNFKKKQVSSTVFEGQNKLKLVTHCRKRSDDFDQYVIKEYLAYRIYNVMTEKSFRVRLLSVNYIDESGKEKPSTHYGFLIEDTRDMAERNGFTHIKVNNIPQEYCDYFYQDLLCVFQYMIGNTDWSVQVRHNIKLLLEKPDHRPIPVPYDFDWSGLVNPVYAKPSEKLGIESVEHRLYRGFVKNPDDFNRIFDLFISKKAEIYSVIEECPLNDKHRELAISYIDEFYEIITDEKKIYRAFVLEAREPNADYWGK